MPFNEGHQNPGNPIPSAGWNAMVDEIKRLGTEKVDTAGGTVSGALALQQTLQVAGAATVGSATVTTSLTVRGAASLAGGATVTGGPLAVTGAVSATGNGSFAGARIGPGAGGPIDTLEVAGNLRIGTMPNGNPVRFTSVWTEFPESPTSQSQICNSTEAAYTSLMVVGNKSRAPNNTRIVGVWDRLEVHGMSCANSFCNLSDGRLKTDVAAIADPLDQLARLRGVSFRWKVPPPGSADGPAPVSMGVIAQEVAEVFPSLVSTIGADRQLGVDYNGLTALLIEAVKQLKADNDELRARVAALEAVVPAG